LRKPERVCHAEIKREADRGNAWADRLGRGTEKRYWGGSHRWGGILRGGREGGNNLPDGFSYSAKFLMKVGGGQVTRRRGGNFWRPSRGTNGNFQNHLGGHLKRITGESGVREC